MQYSALLSRTMTVGTPFILLLSFIYFIYCCAALNAGRSSQEKAVRLFVRLSVYQTRAL